MSWFAVAIGGSALLSGALSYAGSQAQSGAAKDAAQLSNQQYQQSRADMAPWRITGQNALAQYAGELGIPGYNYGTPTGGGAQPQVYGTPTPYTGGADGGAGGGTPGVQAALGTGSGGGSHVLASGLNPLQPFGVLGGALGLGGGVEHGAGSFLTGGLFRHNNSPLQDIRQALEAGIPVTDEQWQVAGYGPGGSDPNAPPSTAGGTPTPFHSAFRETPGYQFAYNEGMRGVNNAFAARGLLNSGARAKGITQFAQGTADQEYNNYLNRLAAVSGLGQTTSTQGAQLGAQFAQNQGSLYQDRAAATASGYAGIGNAINSGLNNYFAYQNYGGMR